MGSAGTMGTCLDRIGQDASLYGVAALLGNGANNELVGEGRAFCLAKPGHVYALYLPDGGNISVSLSPNLTYDAD